MVPDYITHYYLADKKPFLNLSDLSESELASVMGDLNGRRTSAPSFKRIFGRRYMQMRKLTEEKLRRLFIEAGGQPERQVPHYFVLGKSEWFKALAPGMREIPFPIKDIPTAVMSFTYPDSFTAMAFGPQFGLPQVPRPYHERVFRIEELLNVVDEFGLPIDDSSEGHENYHLKPFEKYIEFQVWSDSPIKTYSEI
jgi:hypothetical protein